MIKISIIICAGLLLTASGFAYSENSAKTFYVGAGFNKIELANETNPDGPFTSSKNYLLNAGYNFTSNYAVEVQYSDSYDKGSVNYKVGNFTTSPPTTYQLTAESSLQTSAIYGVYRSSNNLFLKAKAGYINTKMTLTNNHPTYPFNFSDSKSDWAAGLGAGYKFGRSSIELEYTTTADDINIDFTTLIYNYTF